MAFSVSEFKARHFRSLKAIIYPMSNLDVFVGANGVGKTNLYRALEMLQSAAANTIAHDLARDGGLQSAMWAGPRGAAPARVQLSVGLADTNRHRPGVALRYHIEIGSPPLEASASFSSEAQIKEEAISSVGGGRTTRLIERIGPSVMARDERGRPVNVELDILASETALGRLEDPSRYPELEAVRRTLLQWRFYHSLRTDLASPLRQPCVAVATPTLASDGHDLAAVFATLAHIQGDTTDLDRAVDEAFPGARLIIPEPDRTASFGMRFPEFPFRVFEAHELSDGTLRFLALAGALLGYRLPPLIALNEPEASLHPDLMEPLARLIVRAAGRTQIWLVTHSTRLADALVATGVGKARSVTKQNGATQIEGLMLSGTFRDEDD
jgi:predicted ATPase